MIFEFLSSYGALVGVLLFALTFGILVLCLTVHEYAHALVAFKLGDPTPKAMGRVTLNPISHLDPIGALLLVFTGFGWGKPVPFNPYYLAKPREYSALIALAGPASNFLFALLFALLHVFFGGGILGSLLFTAAKINLVLCFFNLIPVHPLDGFKVVGGLLPRNLVGQWEELAPMGIYLLLFMILLNITDTLVFVPVNFVTKLLF